MTLLEERDFRCRNGQAYHFNEFIFNYTMCERDIMGSIILATSLFLIMAQPGKVYTNKNEL